VVVVKRIFKYLQGTIEYGLWYPRSKDFNMKAYTNAYWDGSLDDRKSTSGASFHASDYLVSWVSKKQGSISLSTAEVEYISIVTCCTHILSMKKTLKDIHVKFPNPIPIMCDNTSAISISKNPVMHSKTKHIPIKYNFLREQIVANTVKLVYVPTKEKLESIFTKPLAREPFKYLR